MNDINIILETIKKLLKYNNISYKQLGLKLDLSEATIKRAFAQKTFSLQRLFEICTVLGIDFYQLAQMAYHDQGHMVTELTMEQENALAQEDGLLVLFYLMINGWEIPQIKKEYHIDDITMIKLSTILDRLKLIDLLQNDKYKLLVSRNIKWRSNGPIYNKHHHAIKQEFMQGKFNEEHEALLFETGELTKASAILMKKKIEGLRKSFHELVEMDLASPSKEKHSYGFLMGLRPWIFSLLYQKKIKMK